MSLVGTLGRVALGVMVAKGVGKMMSGRSGSSSGGSSGGGLGGGLGGMLGGLLGGQSSGAGGATSDSGGAVSGTGGLGGLGGLGSLLGGKSSTGGGVSAGGALSGGLGGLLEQIGGGGSATGASAAPQSGSLGDLLNRSLQGEQVAAPDAGQEALARLLIQAMINAAKSDGSIDQAEQQKIVEHLGDDMTADEREFVLNEMRTPLDLDGFVKSVPRGAEKQVYMMSLMGIELDHKAEAQYLDKLRTAMHLSEQDSDAIHKQLGAPTLYS